MCTLLNSTRTPFRLVFIQQTARSPKLLWQGAADLQGPQDNRVHNLWAATSSDRTRSRSRSPGNHGQVLRLWGGRAKWDWRSRRAGLGFGEWAGLLHCSSAGERERRCPSPFFTHLLLRIDPPRFASVRSPAVSVTCERGHNGHTHTHTMIPLAPGRAKR
jgi:hypothetical protein